jgi:ribonuclease J
MKRLELPPTSPVGTRAPEQTVEVPTQLSPAVIKGLNVPVIFPKALEPQVLPKTEKNQTRIIPIGGLRTVGANMTMFEHGDDILIVDGGLEFARGGKSPGFNYLLPDIRFLQPHIKRIKWMLITHGHLDHIGALKNLIPALGFPPIYAAPFTIAMIKKGLEEAGLKNKVQFFPVNPDSGKMSNIGVFKYEFFRVNHTIPDSCGIYIETPSARIMHMGDYKLEFFPRIDKPVDLANYARIASRGIDILLQETTNSYKQDWTTSETKVTGELKQLIQDAPERVIIGNFSTLISRIQDVVTIAEQLGRHVLVNGRSMVDCVAIAREMGILKCKEWTVKPLDSKTMESIPESKQIIITTGAQGEEFGGLNNISRGEHVTISIKPRDTIILSSSIIPGNELAIIDMMNRLNRFGAKIITIKENEVHSGGHGGIAEQRVIMNLVRPKYIIPVHGDITQRLTLKREAVKMGWDPKNVLMLEDGSIVELDERHELVFSRKKIPLEALGVDGMSIGSLETRAVKDRIQLGEEGVLVVNTKDSTIESRGLFFPDEIAASHAAISDYVKKAVGAKKADENEKNFREFLTKDLGKMVLKVWEREPLVVCI